MRLHLRLESPLRGLVLSVVFEIIDLGAKTCMPLAATPQTRPDAPEHLAP